MTTGETSEASLEPLTGELVAVSLPARKGTVEGFDISLDEVKLSQVLFLIAGVGDFEPAPLDEIDSGGKWFVVRGVQKLAPAGVPVIYKIGAVAK